MQNGSASLLDNIRFRLKPPEILYIVHIQNIRKKLCLLFSIGIAHLKKKPLVQKKKLHLIKCMSAKLLGKFQMLECCLQHTIKALFEKAEYVKIRFINSLCNAVYDLRDTDTL